jgi:ABC-type transporter MlaC component
MYRPLYEDTDSYIVQKTRSELDKIMAKQFMNSKYGLCVNVSELSPAQREEFMKAFKKENDMRIKDFIVLHADGQPVMVKKEAITVISKMSDGTTRVEIDNQIWITDDKYEDVIKRLFEV